MRDALQGRPTRASTPPAPKPSNIERLLRDPPGGSPTAERFRMAAAFRRLQTELLTRASLLPHSGPEGRTRHALVALAEKAESYSVQAATGATALHELRKVLAELGAQAKPWRRRRTGE